MPTLFKSKSNKIAASMATVVNKIQTVQKAFKPRSNNLYTPVVRSFVMQAISMGQTFQMHPYTWNKNQKIPEYVQSKWRLALWYFNILLTFAHTTFVIVRCIQTNLDENEPMSKKIYMQFIAVYFVYPSLMQITSLLHGHKMPVFIQGFAELFEVFEKTYFEKGSKKPKLIWICEFLMGNTFASVNNFTLLMVIGSYFRPGSPEHLSSLVEDPDSLSFIQMVPCLLFTFYIELLYHSNLFILVFVEFAFIFPCIIIANELSSELCKLTSSSLRESENKFRVYNALKLLVGSFNDIYSTFLLPVTKAFLIAIIVLSTYGGIRLQGLAGLTLGIIGFSCFISIIIRFRLLAELHERSNTNLRKWKKPWLRSQRYVWEKKVLRSLTPVTVRMSSFYFVDRGMVVTMTERIIQETVNFLLANS